MTRGQRPDYVDRNIWARLRFFDRDKRLDVVHELEGEPYGLRVDLVSLSDDSNPKSGVASKFRPNSSMTMRERMSLRSSYLICSSTKT